MLRGRNKVPVNGGSRRSRPGLLSFTVRVDAGPVRLYYAHHIQDLTDRSVEWLFPGTESA